MFISIKQNGKLSRFLCFITLARDDVRRSGFIDNLRLMSEKQAKLEEPKLEPETWDQENLLAFFKLLLEVDKRLNPQSYDAKNND